MRNLKRALSLAMASIMILGMMVIGAGAVSYDDFSDKDKIVNKEAVNTMVSLGVINGKEDGSYDPTGIVTRAEMAKLIAVMMTGGKDPTLGNITSNFTDTKGNWADSYIAYCANKGIINGKGDGTFGPNEAVTGSAAAKMILTALGYRADIEKLTGAEWEINTNVLANKVKLYDGIETVKPQEGLSRDNTAQMIYNGVQADEVVYRNNYGEYSGVIYAQPINAGVTTNGVAKSSTVLSVRFDVVKVEGVAVANNIIAIDNGATTVGAKTRFVVTGTNTAGNITQSNATYPVAVGNELLGRSVVIYVKYQNALAPNAVNSTVIGTPILSTKNIVAETADRLKDADAVKSFLSGKGLSTMEGTDNNTNIAKGIVLVTQDDTGYVSRTPVRADAVATSAQNTAKAAGVEQTFIDNNGDGIVDFLFKSTPNLAKVTVYNTTDKKLTIAGIGSVDFANVADYDDVAKDDMVLVTKLNETYYLTKSESVSGKVTAYNNSTNKVTLDGTDYGQSAATVTTSATDLTAFTADQSYISNSYTFYLDAHGNAVAWTVSEETVGNYALVLATGGTSASGGSSVIDKGEVKLLLSDGTTATYNVNLLASANKFAIGGSDSQKEATMSARLALANGGANSLVNTLVTYAVGEDKNVTIGNPVTTSSYASVTADGSTTAPNNATFPAQRSTTRYSFTGTNAQTITVNDSTLFFIRDSADATTTPRVVKGLSNMPTSPIKDSTTANATLKSAVYTTTSANPNVAKAVWVDGTFKGTSNYVYVSDKYTQTQNVNGEAIYTYPAVFEDGKADFIKVKGNTATDTVNSTAPEIAKGNVYEYTLDGAGYASLVLNTNTKNNIVATYARGSALTVTPGIGGSGDARTILGTTKIWNVEDTKSVYADTLTVGMDLAFAIDADEFVKVAFVKDSNLDFRPVQNLTAAALTINGASVAANGSTSVANGYDVVISSLVAGNVVTYTIDNDTGADENGTVVVASGQTTATITMPENAVLRITSAGSGTTPPPSGSNLDSFSTVAEIEAALATGNATLTGNYTNGTGRLTIPSGKTLTITGNYTGHGDGDRVQGTLKVNGTYTPGAGAGILVGNIEAGTLAIGANAFDVQGVVKAGTLTGTAAITVAAGGSLEVTTTNSHTTGAYTSSGTLKLPNVPTALTVKDGVTTITGAVSAAVTVEGGTATVGSIANGAVVVGKSGTTNAGGTLNVGVSPAFAGAIGSGTVILHGTSILKAGAVGSALTANDASNATVGAVTGNVVVNGASTVTTGAVTGTVAANGTSIVTVDTVSSTVTASNGSTVTAGVVTGALTMAATSNVAVASAASYANTGTGTLTITAAISGATTLPAGKVVIKETPTAKLTLNAASNVTFEKTLNVTTVLANDAPAGAKVTFTVAPTNLYATDVAGAFYGDASASTTELITDPADLVGHTYTANASNKWIPAT